MKGYLLNMPNTPDENDILNKATEIIIPELYEDGAKPAVKEAGKLIARPLRALNALFSRVDKWIRRKEYSIEEAPITPQVIPQEPSQLQKDIETIKKSLKYDLSSQQKNIYLRFFNKYKKSFSKDDIDLLNKESSKLLPKYDNLLNELLGLIEALEE